MHESPEHQFDPNRRGCAGFRLMLPRRQAMQAGVCGGLGLSLGDPLRFEALADDSGTQAFSAAGGSRGKSPGKALSVIQLHLGGGISRFLKVYRQSDLNVVAVLARLWKSRSASWRLTRQRSTRWTTFTNGPTPY